MAKQESSILDLTQRYNAKGRDFTTKQSKKRYEELNRHCDAVLKTIEDDLQNWENPNQYCSHPNCDGKEHAKGYFYQVEDITCSTLVHDRDEKKSDDGLQGNHYYGSIDVDKMPNGSCPDTDERSVVVVTHIGKIDYSVEKMIERIQSRVKRSVKEYEKLQEVKFLNERSYYARKLHVRAFNARSSEVNVAIWIGK